MFVVRLLFAAYHLNIIGLNDNVDNLVITAITMMMMIIHFKLQLPLRMLIYIAPLPSHP